MEGCDAYFALPADAEYKVKGLAKTNAFLNVSYAIVAPKGLTVTTLSDLKPQKIGVLHASPPQILLASKGSYTTSIFRSQEEAFEALNKKEIDAALLWGPSAGFDNKKLFDNRWQVIPINGEGLGGQVAVAVSKDNPELKDRINKALEELKPEIQQLTVKYGFPLQVPLIVNSRKTNTHYAQSTVTPAKTGFMKVSDKSTQREWLVAESGDTIAEAKSNFNNKCSHCHGSNGASPISERDLRKLKLRYKDEWKEVTYTTITKGRSDYGMPVWGGIIPDEEIRAIIEFLVTVQKN